MDVDWPITGVVLLKDGSFSLTITW